MCSSIQRYNCKNKDYKKKSFSRYDLAVHNMFRFMEKGRICLRVRISKLNDSVLKPLAVGRSSVVHEFLFSPFKGLRLLGQFNLRLAQLSFDLRPSAPGAPVLQVNHLTF